MVDITAEQFLGMKEIAKRTDLFNHVGFDIVNNNYSRVLIVSQVDASFDEVDKLIEAVFPGKEYMGSVGESEDGDYYMINVDGETLVNLMMKKSEVGQ